jgi:hypothetical protein
VSESSVEDYEWKLVPGAVARLPEQEPLDAIDEGIYYVLRLDRRAKKLVLQHDTEHCGDSGPHFFQESFTEIQLGGLGDLDYMRLCNKWETRNPTGVCQSRHRMASFATTWSI